VVVLAAYGRYGGGLAAEICEATPTGATCGPSRASCGYRASLPAGLVVLTSHNEDGIDRTWPGTVRGRNTALFSDCLPGEDASWVPLRGGRARGGRELETNPTGELLLALYPVV
jgi:hypothetical protein